MKTTKAKRKVTKRKAAKKSKLPWHQSYFTAVALMLVGASLIFNTVDLGSVGLLMAEVSCGAPSANISDPAAKSCTDLYTAADPIGGSDDNYQACLTCCNPSSDSGKCKIGCISKRSYLKSCTEAGLQDTAKNATSNAEALNSIDNYLKDATGDSTDTAYKTMANQETQNAAQAQTALAALKQSPASAASAQQTWPTKDACLAAGCKNCVLKTAASGAVSNSPTGGSTAIPSSTGEGTTASQDSFYSSSKVCGGYTSESECLQNKDKCHWGGTGCYDGADTTPAPAPEEVPAIGQGKDNAYCTANDQCESGECSPVINRCIASDPSLQ